MAGAHDGAGKYVVVPVPYTRQRGRPRPLGGVLFRPERSGVAGGAALVLAHEWWGVSTTELALNLVWTRAARLPSSPECLTRRRRPYLPRCKRS